MPKYKELTLSLPLPLTLTLTLALALTLTLINQDVPEYKELVSYWMENRYTLRYTGGLVPDVCQQFTKKMGVFSNPTSKSSPAKIRLAFEAAPFGYL